MRITADILDDDCFLVGVTSEKEVQTKEPRDSRQEFQNPCCSKFHEYSVKHPEGTSSAPNIQHCQIMNEMTQQFRNLHVSDAIPSSIRRKFAVIMNHSNTMEKQDSDVSNPPNSDAAPLWLLQYLSKMKNDIKKEVIEELLTLPQPELPCSQVGASEKLEKNNLPEVIHYGIFCDNCDQLIHGIRYKCSICSDYDLCQECENLPNVHNKNHIFLKIRYPVTLKLYQKQKSDAVPSSTGQVYTLCPKTSYFKLCEAKFICDETIPDGTVLNPSTRFVKSWRVQNNGTFAWDDCVKLQHIHDSSGFSPPKCSVDVPHLEPGEEGIVSVILTSPSKAGTYNSRWRFYYKDRPFGHKIWCKIVVKDVVPENKNEVENMAAKSLTMPVLDIPNEKGIENQRNEVASIEQVLSAVKEEHDRGNMVPRKLAVSSYTTTPNNTPFDLTPPKSPDHHETCVKEIQDINPENNSAAAKNNDSDDDCSILSISSSESDTEFVVIPLPKCFNLSESFASYNMSVLTNYETKTEQCSEQKSVEEENKSTQNSKRTGTVSQETGVPELSEHIENTSIETDSEKKIVISHVTNDGSSSEISIIESDDNSPTTETVMPTIDSISVAVSNEMDLKPSLVCEVKYPIPDVFKDNSSAKERIFSEEYRSEEHHSENLSSTTFPKFPVEGITSAYEPVPPNHIHEERTIQVLPEGLVTGALSAAASVYNTARAVISTMQQPRNERITGLSQDPPVVLDNQPEQTISQSSVLKPMDQLVEMGFCNRQQNEQLLMKHNSDVALVVEELVNLNDNEWYASRHVGSQQD